MRFQTKDIGDDGIDVDLPIGAPWLAQHCGDVGARLGRKGLRLSGRLERSDDDFLLRGRLRGHLDMDCSRCLEGTAVPIDVSIAVVFVEGGARGPHRGRDKDKPPARHGRGKGDDKDQVRRDDEGGDDDDDASDGDRVTFADGVIDVAETLREEILLAVPMSPLCTPGCLGLCPICGGNRNQSPCDCVERRKVALSPLAALAKLKS